MNIVKLFSGKTSDQNTGILSFKLEDDINSYAKSNGLNPINVIPLLDYAGSHHVEVMVIFESTK